MAVMAAHSRRPRRRRPVDLVVAGVTVVLLIPLAISTLPAVQDPHPGLSVGITLALLSGLICRRLLPTAALLTFSALLVATAIAVLSGFDDRDTLRRCAVLIGEEAVGIVTQAVVTVVALVAAANRRKP